MNEIYFEKLRSLYSKQDKYSVNEDDVTQMIRLYDMLLEFHRITRKEGLVEAATIAERLSDKGCEGFFKKIMLLATEGGDTWFLTEMALMTFFSGTYSDFEKLICLMCLRGIVLIQEGISPYYLELVLKSFFVGEVGLAFMEREEKMKLKKKNDLLNKIDMMVNKCDEAYFSVPAKVLLSEKIMEMKTSEIEKFYVQIKKSDWAKSIRALSGDAVRRLLENIDVDEAAYLLEEMEHLSVRRTVAEECCEHILDELKGKT